MVGWQAFFHTFFRFTFIIFLIITFIFEIGLILICKPGKKLVQATFVSVLNNGDAAYRHAAAYTLHLLLLVMFMTHSGSRNHHCTLYRMMVWPSLSLHRKFHLYIFVYKASLGKLPSYLCHLLTQTSSCVQLHSTRWLSYHVPQVFTDQGKKPFSYFASRTWNNLQNILHLNNLVPL